MKRWKVGIDQTLYGELEVMAPDAEGARLQARKVVKRARRGLAESRDERSRLDNAIKHRGPIEVREAREITR